MKEKKKKLFKVILNWHGELHVTYTRARIKSIALRNAVASLAKKLKLSEAAVAIRFFNQNHCSILEVKEKEEKKHD